MFNWNNFLLSFKFHQQKEQQMVDKQFSSQVHKRTREEIADDDPDAPLHKRKKTQYSNEEIKSTDNNCHQNTQNHRKKNVSESNSSSSSSSSSIPSEVLIRILEFYPTDENPNEEENTTIKTHFSCHQVNSLKKLITLRRVCHLFQKRIEQYEAPKRWKTVIESNLHFARTLKEMQPFEMTAQSRLPMVPSIKHDALFSSRRREIDDHQNQNTNYFDLMYLGVFLLDAIQNLAIEMKPCIDASNSSQRQLVLSLPSITSNSDGMNPIKPIILKHDIIHKERDFDPEEDSETDIYWDLVDYEEEDPSLDPFEDTVYQGSKAFQTIKKLFRFPWEDEYSGHSSFENNDKNNDKNSNNNNKNNIQSELEQYWKKSIEDSTPETTTESGFNPNDEKLVDPLKKSYGHLKDKLISFFGADNMSMIHMSRKMNANETDSCSCSFLLGKYKSYVAGFYWTHYKIDFL